MPLFYQNFLLAKSSILCDLQYKSEKWGSLWIQWYIFWKGVCILAWVHHLSAWYILIYCLTQMWPPIDNIVVIILLSSATEDERPVMAFETGSHRCLREVPISDYQTTEDWNLRVVIVIDTDYYRQDFELNKQYQIVNFKMTHHALQVMFTWFWRKKCIQIIHTKQYMPTKAILKCYISVIIWMHA